MVMAYMFEWVRVSRSVVPYSLRPHGLQPTGLLCLRFFQARILEWVAVSLNSCLMFSFGEGVMNYKGIALLLCQAKGDTLGVCLKKLCVSTPENLMRVFITMDQRWGSYVFL